MKTTHLIYGTFLFDIIYFDNLHKKLALINQLVKVLS
jgi:hypothetical protein